jgi:Domain of unknown function (DUF4189)
MGSTRRPRRLTALPRTPYDHGVPIPDGGRGKRSVRLSIAAVAFVCIAGGGLDRAVAAKPSDRYASIWLDLQSGAFGSGEGKTHAGASRRAEAACAGDCDEVIWVRNGCAALAAGAEGNYGADYARTRKKARSRALSEAGEGAQLLVVTCTS